MKIELSVETQGVIYFVAEACTHQSYLNSSHTQVGLPSRDVAPDTSNSGEKLGLGKRKLLKLIVLAGLVWFFYVRPIKKEVKWYTWMTGHASLSSSVSSTSPSDPPAESALVKSIISSRDILCGIGSFSVGSVLNLSTLNLSILFVPLCDIHPAYCQRPRYGPSAIV